MTEYETASLCKRLFSNLIDLVIVLTLSIISYMCIGFPLGKSTMDFDGSILYQKQLALDIYDHMYSTHLYIKDDNDQPLDAANTYKRYTQALLLDEKNEDGEYNNPLAYYYITFANEYTVEEFNLKILDVEGNNSDVFQYRDNDKSKVCELRRDNNFYGNIYQYSIGTNSEDAIRANERLTAQFQKAWYLAVEHEKGKPAIQSLVAKYNESLDEQGFAIGIPAFICVGINLLLFYGIIPLFFKKRTLGKMFETIYVRSDDTRELSIGKYIIRFILYLLRFSYLPFIIMWITAGLQNACIITLVRTSTFTIPYATIAFVAFGLEIINLFIVCINKKHKSYIDLLTFTQNLQICTEEKEKQNG